MNFKTLIFWILTPLMWLSCIAYKPVPSVKDIGLDPFGSFIEISMNNKSGVKGEIIAIDSANIWVLVEGEFRDGCIIIDIDEIKSYTVTYANPRNFSWTIPTFMTASISHGLWAIFTMPLNLAVTVSATLGAKKSLQYNEKTMGISKLNMFARFPQGIPAHIDKDKLTFRKSPKE